MKKIFLSTFFFFGILSAYSQSTIASEPNKNWQIGIGYNQFWVDATVAPKPCFHFEITKAISKHWVLTPEVNIGFRQSGYIQRISSSIGGNDTIEYSYRNVYLRFLLNYNYFFRKEFIGFYVGGGFDVQIFHNVHEYYKLPGYVDLACTSCYNTFLYTNLHFGYEQKINAWMNLKGQFGYGFSNLNFVRTDYEELLNFSHNTNPIDFSLTLAAKF